MQKAELVLINGNVITIDAKRPRGSAVAVAGGKITAVGDDSAVSGLVGPQTEVVDLAGKTLLPGFNDSHLHMLSYGTSLLNVRLAGLNSIEAMVRRVAEKAAATPPGQWIIGNGWDQNLYVEKRYPDRYDLDRVAPDHPVSLRHVSGHALLVNSRAIDLAGITRDTPDPEGGRIDRDPAGEPTGVLRETASALVSRFYFPNSYETAKEAMRLAMANAVAAGITSVTDDSARSLAGGYREYFRLLSELWAEGAPMARSYQLIYYPELDTALAEGLKTGDGDEKVKVGAIKFFADGSFMAQTAALREPFCDKPESRGLFYIQPEELKRMVEKAHLGGFQTAIHAIGDAGIDASLDAVEAALAAEAHPDHRHRIIHFEVLTEDILARAKRLGVTADIQPKFVATQGGWVEDRVGPERAKLTFPWRTVLACGIPCAGSSDCPVEPFEPLLGIHAAVNRQVDNVPGMVFQPEERLSVPEALRLFTLGGAYVCFEENSKGSVTPGKLADLTVLSDDPIRVPPETIRDLRVVMTIIDGKIVYRAE